MASYLKGFMKKLLCLGLILISTVCAFAQVTNTNPKVNLAWDGNCDVQVTSYGVYFTTNKLSVPRTNVIAAYVDDCGTNRPTATNIYYGSYSSTNVVISQGRTNTTATVTNLTRGATYYFIVRSRNSFGLESDDSNEVGFTVPTVPTNLPPTKVEGFRILLIN